MPIRNAGEIEYLSFANGLDNTSVVGSRETRNTLSVADNVDLVDESLCKKRSGTAPKTTTAWGQRKIRRLFEMVTSTGSRKLMCFGENAVANGTSGTFGVLNGTTITTVAASLLDGVKPQVVQFGTRAFVFNNGNDFVYDGTNKTQIGITPPTIAPAFSANVAGSMDNGLNFLGVYTYYNSQTGAESSPSPASAAVVPTIGGISWTVTPGDSVTADKIRFYRTVGNGSLFFLDGETTISSSTYNTTNADTSLGQQLEEDNTRPTACYLATVNENRIFAVASLNKSRVIHSKIGQTGPMPESFQVDDFVDCNPNDGNEIRILGTINGITLVIKDTTIGKLIPINAFQSNELEAGGYQKYVYQEIAQHITCVPNTGISIDNIFIWLGKEDIYGTDGVQIIRLGARIRNTLNTLDFTRSYKFDVVNKVDTKQIIFTVIRTGKTEPDYQIVGHYRNAPKVAWTVYTPGLNEVTHPGIKASALVSATENGTAVYYYGSSDAVGTIYKMNTGNSDSGSGIYFDARLPWESLERSAKIKTFHSYYNMLLGDGNDYDITHTFEINKQESIVKTATTNLSDPNAPYWDAENWDEFNWASLAFTPKKFFPHKKAYFGRYGFNNINADEPIFCIGVTAAIQVEALHR